MTALAPPARGGRVTDPTRAFRSLSIPERDTTAWPHHYDRPERPTGGAVTEAGTADPHQKRRVAALAVLAALIAPGRRAGHHQGRRLLASHRQLGTSPRSRTSATAAATPTGTRAAAVLPREPGPLPAFGLVGGARSPSCPATGKLAIKGSAGDILFAEDGTVLDASARQVVAVAAREIRRHEPSAVTVTGYTDAIGNAAVNHRRPAGGKPSAGPARRGERGAAGKSAPIPGEKYPENKLQLFPRGRV